MHATLEDVLLDIVQNSIEAGASLITLDFLEEDGKIKIMIGDNGKGMDDQTRQNALDPFYSNGKKHSKRKVGLGLPFLKQMAEGAHGTFELDSQENIGTSIFFDFESAHSDAPPIEDLPGCFVSLLLFEGDYELRFHHRTSVGSYSVNRSELKAALGEIQSVSSIQLAKQYFESQEDSIKEKIL